MGFFNKILKGLGFEGDEEEIQEKPKKQKEKQKKQKVTASYNLDEEDLNEDIEKESLNEQVDQTSQQTEVVQEEKSTIGFELVKLNNQVDAQNVVNKIKSGKKVLINLENLSSADITRSLDFITGATFALGLTMQKVDEKLYLIQ